MVNEQVAPKSMLTAVVAAHKESTASLQKVEGAGGSTAKRRSKQQKIKDKFIGEQVIKVLDQLNKAEAQKQKACHVQQEEQRDR